MRRIISVVLILVLVLSQSNIASSRGLNITINGDKMIFEEKPYIENGRTMMPVRAVTTMLGATKVEWNGENQLVIINYDEKQLIMKIGKTTYWIDGEEFTMDVPPVIKESRTMVPLRLIAESMSCAVGWESETQTVEIVKEGLVVEDIYKDIVTYTKEDLEWLARITYVEGLDIGYEAKLAIANVVLNRVKSSIFPNSVYDVIFETDYAVQFPPAHKTGFRELSPSAESWIAAEDALDGINNIEDCLYFNNSPFRSKADDLHRIIEGEYFYK